MVGLEDAQDALVETVLLGLLLALDPGLELGVLLLQPPETVAGAHGGHSLVVVR